MKNEASKRGKRSRRKGLQFEREIAIQLRSIFPEARRHLEYQDAEANGVDLVGTWLFRIQCKKLRKYAPISAIREVTYDSLFGEIPVLITAGDHEPPIAALPLSDFMRLLKSYVK